MLWVLEHGTGLLGNLLGWSALCQCCLGGCHTGSEQTQDRGDFILSWTPVPAEIAPLWREIDGMRMFDDLAEALNARYALPRDLIIEHRQCGAVNAYYEGDRDSIWLCYELLSSIGTLAAENGLPQPDVFERIRGTWLFIFFHELGHALIDYYDIPIAGSEEDAADNFATLSLLDSDDGAQTALLAAGYWGASDSRIYDELDFADQHALNAQRFYGILCLVYGSDPAAHADLVDDGTLSSQRAAKCREEYERVRESWRRLLGAWTHGDEDNL